MNYAKVVKDYSKTVLCVCWGGGGQCWPTRAFSSFLLTFTDIFSKLEKFPRELQCGSAFLPTSVVAAA